MLLWFSRASDIIMPSTEERNTEMKPIKIKHKEAIYILNFHKRHLFEKLFCVWHLQITCANAGKLTCDMRWWFYILAFLPLHFLVLLGCLWNGGLRDFEILPRRFSYYAKSGPEKSGDSLTFFGRMKNVWDFHRRPSMRGERN